MIPVTRTLSHQVLLALHVNVVTVFKNQAKNATTEISFTMMPVITTAVSICVAMDASIATQIDTAVVITGIIVNEISVVAFFAWFLNTVTTLT